MFKMTTKLTLSSSVIVIMAAVLQVVQASGYAEVRLVDFRNPFGTTALGKACDSIFGSTVATSECDHLFDVCVSSTNQAVCDVAVRNNVGPIADANSVVGEHHLISFGFSSPITLTDLHIHVTVRDHDSDSKKELVDYYELQVYAVNPNWSWVRLGAAKGARRLELEVRVNCSDHFYGNDCLLFCEPSERNTCSLDGQIACVDGWSGMLCNVSLGNDTSDSHVSTTEPPEKLANSTATVLTEFHSHASAQESTVTTAELKNTTQENLNDQAYDTAALQDDMLTRSSSYRSLIVALAVTVLFTLLLLICYFVWRKKSPRSAPKRQSVAFQRSVPSEVDTTEDIYDTTEDQYYSTIETQGADSATAKSKRTSPFKRLVDSLAFVKARFRRRRSQARSGGNTSRGPEQLGVMDNVYQVSDDAGNEYSAVASNPLNIDMYYSEVDESAAGSAGANSSSQPAECRQDPKESAAEENCYAEPISSSAPAAAVSQMPADSSYAVPSSSLYSVPMS